MLAARHLPTIDVSAPSSAIPLHRSRVPSSLSLAAPVELPLHAHIHSIRCFSICHVAIPSPSLSSSKGNRPHDNQHVQKNQRDPHERAHGIYEVYHLGFDARAVLHAAAKGGLGLLGRAPADWIVLGLCEEVRQAWVEGFVLRARKRSSERTAMAFTRRTDTGGMRG